MSVEDRSALVRVRHLQESPVALRFLSMEPLLASIGDFDVSSISWIIVGGESGPRCRPMEENWVCEVKDLCEDNAIPFFFKQWGGFRPKAGGRKLAGLEYNGMPVMLGS